MPDFEYDKLLRELEDLEKANPHLIRPDSPAQRVGGVAVSEFQNIIAVIRFHKEIGKLLDSLFRFHTILQFSNKSQGHPLRLRFRQRPYDC